MWSLLGLQTFRPWRLIREPPRTLTYAMLCSKLTANMSHKQSNDWGVADIDYITVCPGLPIPPISREHGVRLKSLA
ncbi:MAG: hypothetical protein JO082_14230 [Mycobacterium sp.]|nr:hypothetical protein [Mycobacterium sp.]MBV9723059.1 hypothetical protein [Mycobacterium sp.]